MLRIRIIVVDRTRASFLREGEAFYLKRLRRYVKTDWVEVKPTGITKGRTEEEILLEEGRALAKRLSPGDTAIPLDRKGKAYDSRGLARRLDGLSHRSGGSVCFIIGGPLGISGEVLERAEEALSLSRLTLTHEMSRLILLEQLYRACTILAGEKYHK